MRKIVSALSFLILTLSLTSCLITAVGVGVAVESGNTAFEFGKLSAVVNAKPEDVKNAVLEAFKTQNIKELKTDDYVQNITIFGQQTDGDKEKVDIHIDVQGTEASKLIIHFGIFGNEKTSKQLYDQILASLKTK